MTTTSAAAVAADVVTFTPVSLQPESDATIYTPISVWYLPAWLLLVGAGIGCRRHTHGAAGRTAP
jgi:hypothetical protein